MELNRKLVLVSLLYFAEGFPFGIIEQAFPIYFREHHLKIEHMGLLSLVSLPYALKFFWAPAVDFLGSRRRWICAAQFAMAAALCMFVSCDPWKPTMFLWACVGALAVFSATQDIAVDAYTIELLKSSEMGIANGFRQAAYRVAMLTAGGLFVSLGGRIGWQITFLIAAGILAICSLISLRLPSVEIQRPKFSSSVLLESVRELMSRNGALSVFLFILLYKLGDMAMGPMVRPFWLERGLNTDQIGLITGSLGMLSAIAGGLSGGFFIMRFGIFRGLWMLGLLQAVSNLSYAWVASYPETGHVGIYIASGIESFCAGLGTSAFLAFLMSICNKQFSATQYAILSASFKITGILAGVSSGWAVGHMGYAQYFLLTFGMSLPAFIFLLPVRKWIPVEQKTTETDTV